HAAAELAVDTAGAVPCFGLPDATAAAGRFEAQGGLERWWLPPHAGAVRFQGTLRLDAPLGGFAVPHGDGGDGVVVGLDREQGRARVIDHSALSVPQGGWFRRRVRQEVGLALGNDPVDVLLYATETMIELSLAGRVVLSTTTPRLGRFGVFVAHGALTL